MDLDLQSGARRLCHQGPLAQIWGSLLTACGPTCLASGFLGGFGDRPTSESTHRVVSIWTLDRFICMCPLGETGTVIPSSLGGGENEISFEQLPAAGRTRKLFETMKYLLTSCRLLLGFCQRWYPLSNEHQEGAGRSRASLSTASGACSPVPQPQVTLGPHVCLTLSPSSRWPCLE